MSKNVGIDLGTTHSLVAVVMSGKARCLLDDAGRAILPSAVRYDEDDETVGFDALARAHIHPERTITSVKRFMGRSAREAAAEAELVPYRVVADDGPIARFDVGHGRTVNPLEVSAEILRVLRARATDLLLSPPSGAVITVPAYFDDAQRQATRDAGRLAGLEVLRLLNEPTAAALAYGLQNAQRGVWAVYDLGGGTFDVSILELTDGVFQVKSTAGDTHLGGDDFDRALVAELARAAGLDMPGGGSLRVWLTAAEKAKRDLSDAATADVRITVDGAEIATSITRDRFEALIRPIVERTATACRQAIRDGGLDVAAIDGVILVGGSTRVPLVRQYVAELFGKEPLCAIDPDEVVALGAAIQADILTGTSKLAEDILLLDVIPLSLGLEVMGGVVERLIPRCSMIPAEAHATFTTHVDGQTGVDLHVLQGERDMVRDNRSLARFKLTGIPPMPAGLPRVEVGFLVDADGILTVTAREKHTGVEASIEVLPSYGLDDDLIETMLEASIDHAEADVGERMLVEARVEAEQIRRALDKAMVTDPSLLHPGEAERLRAVSDELGHALEAVDHHRIQALSKQLDEVSAPFAQRRIERDLKLALEGQDASAVGRRLGLHRQETEGTP
jgi:molecular chaperone HscA